MSESREQPVRERLRQWWEQVRDAIETAVAPAPQPVPIPVRPRPRGR